MYAFNKLILLQRSTSLPSPVHGQATEDVVEDSLGGKLNVALPGV